MTWALGRADCVAEGSDLPVIRSPAEFNALIAMYDLHISFHFHQLFPHFSVLAVEICG